MASLKTKGDLAELKVAADLVERGYRIAIPFGEDSDFDLIICRDDGLERVQSSTRTRTARSFLSDVAPTLSRTVGFARPSTTQLRRSTG
jgi:hypothetical protein